ncbi:MAG: phosphatidylglycerol lysyltransferase domain-containing protein [Candidatus Limivicinus sp.]
MSSLQFKPVTLRDKAWVDPIVMAENSPSADYNFGNIYIWDQFYKQSICRYENRMLTRLDYGEECAFVYPIGSGPLAPAIEALRACCAENGCPLVFYGVTEKHRDALAALYPGCFTFEKGADYADYIYSAEKLATYAGKALHGKKNHCNRFEAEQDDWDFVPITRERIPGCLEMLELWTEENAGRLDSSIRDEHEAILRAFADYEALGLEGGILRSGGEILGFSLGEMASPDTFNVHFEKAETAVNGAYPMVCRELTRMVMQLHPGLRYVNREDDMGLETLRKSKLSYRPEFLLEKYSARWTA